MTDHATLAEALVAALADLTVVEKGHTANAGSYSYTYADLADVVKLTRRSLADHGLVALTPVHEHGTGLAVTVEILHASGDSMRFDPLPFPHGRDAQATGSAITYHRRYALTAALGIAAGDDDDGAAATRQEPQAAPVPGFRSSLMAATENLSDAERALLREWLRENGLPDRPSKMDADQAERVCDFILHGLPQVDETEAEGSSEAGAPSADGDGASATSDGVVDAPLPLEEAQP